MTCERRVAALADARERRAGALDVVLSRMRCELGRGEVPFGQLLREAGVVQVAGSHDAVGRELPHALVVDATLIPGGTRACQRGARLLERRLGGTDALGQLTSRARIEERCGDRIDDRDARALVDVISRAERNAFELPGERRRDDVAVADPRATILLDDLLEGPARDPRGVDRDRRRHQARSTSHHGRRHDQRPEPSRHPRLHRAYSRVFRTLTRSSRSMRRRTIRALAAPAARTTMALQA